MNTPSSLLRPRMESYPPLWTWNLCVLLSQIEGHLCFSIQHLSSTRCRQGMKLWRKLLRPAIPGYCWITLKQQVHHTIPYLISWPPLSHDACIWLHLLIYLIIGTCLWPCFCPVLPNPWSPQIEPHVPSVKPRFLSSHCAFIWAAHIMLRYGGWISHHIASLEVKDPVASSAAGSSTAV